MQKKSATHKVTGIYSENKQIANKLHKPKTTKLRQVKGCSSFKEKRLGCRLSWYAFNK